ncbi:glycosyltransferase family 4 protein [Priestia megaterium]
MKVTILHPLKHHVYHSIYGAKKSCHEINAVLGLYDNNNILSKFLKHSKHTKKFKGYKFKKIDDVVQTKVIYNLYFLLFQKYKHMHDRYVTFFDKKSIKLTNSTDCVHVLQDYCKDIISFAKKNNKIVIYEQIQPISYKQREILSYEVFKNNFVKEYIDKFFPENKIISHMNNMKKADYIHTASRLSYDTAVEIVGETNRHKVMQWPYGVDSTILGKQLDLREIAGKDFDKSTLNILYVGSISLIKGTQYLIEVAEQLKNQNIKFTVVGLPRYQEDNVLVDKLLSLKNVSYLGSIPNSEIGEVYKNNDVFLFPALMEGFGMVTLEAMSYGLPCIVNTNCEGVIQDGKDGFVIDPQNSEQIKSKILKLFFDRSLLKKMTINAYENSQKFTWDVYSERWKEFYNSLN